MERLKRKRKATTTDTSVVNPNLNDKIKVEHVETQERNFQAQEDNQQLNDNRQLDATNQNLQQKQSNISNENILSEQQKRDAKYLDKIIKQE